MTSPSCTGLAPGIEIGHGNLGVGNAQSEADRISLARQTSSVLVRCIRKCRSQIAHSGRLSRGNIAGRPQESALATHTTFYRQTEASMSYLRPNSHRSLLPFLSIAITLAPHARPESGARGRDGVHRRKRERDIAEEGWQASRRDRPARRVCGTDMPRRRPRRVWSTPHRASNALLPSMVLRATDAAGNDLAGVTVTLDGVALPTGLNGRAVPADPGTHTLRFEAAGRPPVDKTVLLAEGEKDRRVSVVIGEASAAAPHRATVQAAVRRGARRRHWLSSRAASGSWGSASGQGLAPSRCRMLRP